MARALRERGHEVLVVSDAANRDAVLAAGLAFEAWSSAPNRQAMGGADDPLQDWRPRLPPAIVRAVCVGVITGPSMGYATDTAAILRRFAADVVVSNELLFGVIVAAESMGVPIALLTANVWCYPTRQDAPPFGPGLSPPVTAFGRWGQGAARRMIGRWYDAGLADLNRTRRAFGLAPLTRCLDQLDACDRILLGVSAAFDYGAGTPPAPFAYVGPLGQTPGWAVGTGAGAELIALDRPNVLVSFSTTHQDQTVTLGRTITALSALPVRAIVTLGPAFAKAALPSARNVTIVARADHDVLAPRCDLVVCHGGHGTMLRPLLHGKPVICIPTGRDQPDNAQRIVVAGAGLRLPRRAGVGRIRRAIDTVLGDRRYTDAAQRLALALSRDNVGAGKAVALLEDLAFSQAAASGPRTARRA